MKMDFAEAKKRVAAIPWERFTNVREVRKKLQARSVLGLTLEAQHGSVELVRRDADGTYVLRSLTLEWGADAVAADPEKCGQNFAEQLVAAGIRERGCVVCVPPGWALTTSAEVPEMSAEDLRGFLELRAERDFSTAATDLRLAHSTYASAGGQVRATVAAIPAKRVDAVEQMLEAAGCRIVSMSLGVEDCRGVNEPPTLHFLANGNHVDCVIAAGGGIAGMRSLAGSAVPGSVAFDAPAFAREVRITLGRLPEDVRQQVQLAQFGGTVSSAEALCRELRGPLQRLGIASELRVGQGPPAGQIAAQRHLAHEPLAFEFHVPEARKWEAWLQRFDSRNRRWMIGAALGLVVLPILAFFVRGRIENNLSTEWQAMGGNVGQLESLQQKIRQFRPWFETAPHSLQLLEGLTGAFPEQGEVWAKSIQLGEDGKVTCTGFAKSQPALLALLDRLRARADVSGLQVQQVRGENPVQFSLTYKWEARDAK